MAWRTKLYVTTMVKVGRKFQERTRTQFWDLQSYRREFRGSQTHGILAGTHIWALPYCLQPVFSFAIRQCIQIKFSTFRGPRIYTLITGTQPHKTKQCMSQKYLSTKITEKWSTLSLPPNRWQYLSVPRYCWPTLAHVTHVCLKHISRNNSVKK